MSGCYGNNAYDRWLEARQNKYWESVLVDDEEPTEEEQREAAAEAAWEAREGK
jgi:hypothetical protein